MIPFSIVLASLRCDLERRRTKELESGLGLAVADRRRSSLETDGVRKNLRQTVEIQVAHVGPDLQFATAEVAKSTAEGLKSSSDGPSAASSDGKDED